MARDCRQVEPAYREDGKYVCPECLSRENLKVVDYGTDNGLFLFVVRCQKCHVEFRVKKDV